MKSLRHLFKLFTVLCAITCVNTACLGAETTDSPTSNNYPFGVSSNPKESKQPTPNNEASVIKTLGGLGLVLGLIFALAKIGKKFHPNISAPNRALKILSTLSLGTKEKVALIQIGEKQLLIGVTTHNINTLLELAEPIDIDNSKPTNEKTPLSARTASEFSRKLNEFLLAGQRNK
jgi:flagellar protein FliO/FliZ